MEKDLLDQLIEEGCMDAERYFECGDQFWKAGLFERAILACDRAIELKPDFARAFNRRGAAKYGLQDFAAAILDYDRAIELDPKVTWPLVNRGLAKTDSGGAAGAILDFNKAIELDPNVAKGFGGRGNANIVLKEYAAAILDFDRAIELDPCDVAALSNRGLAKLLLGQEEAAILDLDRAIELAPYIALAFNSRGGAKSKLGLSEAAIEDFNKAIQLDSNAAATYHNRGNEYLDLSLMAEARQDFLRSQSLPDREPIQKRLHNYLTHWSTTFPAPYLVHQLLTEYPHAREMTSLHTLVADNARQCRPLLRWQAWAGQQLEGRNLLWFNTFLHLGMGDPITANRLLEDLDDDSENDLALQYWLAQTSQDILHEERDDILAFATTAARALQSDDPRQHYYAGRILELANADTEALAAYARATDWWLAAVAAAELAQNGQSGLNVFPQGLPVSVVQPTPEGWLVDLEMAVLFYDLEAAITAQTDSAEPFPRFWELWNTDALVEPLRKRLAEEKEAELKARFAEVLKRSTNGRTADDRIFLEHFGPAKMPFETIRNSQDVVASLASMIATYPIIPASDCALFIEHFYLTGNVPEEEVFYLYFFLVQRRGLSPSTTAAEEGLTEVGKGVLETLVKSTVPLLNLFGEPAVAGAAEYLKVLFRQMLSNRGSLLGKPGEPTAYEQFKASFRSHIADTMDVLGSREAFLKQYPIEGFGDLL